MLWALGSYLMKYINLHQLKEEEKYGPKYNKYIINTFLTAPEHTLN